MQFIFPKLLWKIKKTLRASYLKEVHGRKIKHLESDEVQRRGGTGVKSILNVSDTVYFANTFIS